MFRLGTDHQTMSSSSNQHVPAYLNTLLDADMDELSWNTDAFPGVCRQPKVITIGK